MVDTSKLIDLVAAVRDIPFQFIGSRDVESMLKAGVGTCNAKHTLLKQKLSELGYQVRFVIDSFYLSDFLSGLDESESVSQLKNLAENIDPYFHTYLQILIDDQWISVDITFDAELERFGFIVASHWDGKSDTKLPHNTVEQYIVEDDPASFKQKLLAGESDENKERRKEFFALLNDYLCTIRKSVKTAFIFHGTEGYPEENWFPWMKLKLEGLGYRVIVPQFPTPENQTPELWMKVFKHYEQYYSEDSIVFGHSLGGTFLLHLLQTYDLKIAAAFFIASPIGIMPIKNIETDKPFLDVHFNWDMIRNHAQYFAVFHSDNDPYVCLENGQELAKNLHVDLQLIKNSGHFNTTFGFTIFPQLFDYFKKVL